jgi:peptide deformylase
MYKLVQTHTKEGDAILRATSAPVSKNEFGTPELKKMIQEMKEIAHRESDGVALAAPQIGINKRIFVIDETRGYKPDAIWRPSVFINPTITKTSNKQEIKDEGCLSVRGIYGNTWRATNVTVKAYDENGNVFSYGAGGLVAHIVQHEIDHLDGVLFTDHGFDFRDDPDHPKENY